MPERKGIHLLHEGAFFHDELIPNRSMMLNRSIYCIAVKGGITHASNDF
jgi:hypothetical protein